MAILFPVKREIAILFFVKRDLDPPFTTLFEVRGSVYICKSKESQRETAFRSFKESMSSFERLIIPRLDFFLF